MSFHIDKIVTELLIISGGLVSFVTGEAGHGKYVGWGYYGILLRKICSLAAFLKISYSKNNKKLQLFLYLNRYIYI